MVPGHAHGDRGGDGQWEWNVAASRLHLSPRWAALVGADERDVGTTPESWLAKIHPDDLDRVTAALKALTAVGGPDHFDLPHRLRHANGSYRWMSCRGIVQRGVSGEAERLVGAHADVTGDTVIDPETGLPNRLLLIEHLTRSIERATRYPGFHFALLSVDLDRADARLAVQPPPDDPLLVAAARRLETCLRIGDAASSFRHDDLVARMDGDRFAILVDGLKDVGDTTAIADRVVTTLMQPFTMRDDEVFLSPCVGVAVSATGYAAADAVLRDAETALHRAKLLGKARYEVFDTAILKTAQTELRLEADFAGALERHEFQVFYQPIVAVDGHAIVGFEALARWQHPGLGMVSPLDFIPLAEKTGFILPLGSWILREACLQLKAWQQLPSVRSDLWVSVNVSGAQFRHEPLFAEIQQVVTDTGLDPRHLVLELTEGIAADRPGAVRAVLMQLRSLGIRISVDDFGTGYSSLARLRQFPIDCLKVDRALVRGMEASAEMARILGSVTDMARTLGLHVVVEGVENAAQLALLRPAGCQFVQGYVFSKPLDAARATALLERRTHLEAPADVVPARTPMLHAPARRAPGTTRRRWVVGASVGAAAAVAVVAASVLLGPRDDDVPSPGADVPAPPRPVETIVPASAPRLDTTSGITPAATPPTVAPSLPSATKAGRVRSARVVHQHRLGSCRGVLKASAQGLEFAPEAPGGNDAFTVGHGDFLHDLDGEALVLKTSDRTFRFQAVDVNGKRDSRELMALVGTLKARR